MFLLVENRTIKTLAPPSSLEYKYRDLSRGCQFGNFGFVDTKHLKSGSFLKRLVSNILLSFFFGSFVLFGFKLFVWFFFKYLVLFA